jgi:hypothetical protein
MPKTNAFAQDVLNYFFRAIAPSGYGANLWLSLHTSTPGAAGNQTTNEATFAGYARISIPRDNTGFAITAQTIRNIAELRWPAITSGAQKITHFGIGTDSSGTGKLLSFDAFIGGLEPTIEPPTQIYIAATSATVEEE